MKLGVLGGLGPLATVDFLDKFYRCGPVSRDQDHPPVEVKFCTQIPDRSDFLNGVGESPLEEMVLAARGLREAGAELGVLVCNTAHVWFDELQQASGLRFLHIADPVRERLAGSSRPAALLCTPWTVMGKVYSSRLPVETLLEPSQFILDQMLMPAIRLLKANRFDEGRALVQQVLNLFEYAGCESAILGCTELPLVAASCRTEMTLLDPNLLLAQEAWRQCKSRAEEAMGTDVDTVGRDVNVLVSPAG
jgi:aspartate racemase